jgi:hypothetical protein
MKNIVNVDYLFPFTTDKINKALIVRGDVE